jgi:hypothetical protein
VWIEDTFTLPVALGHLVEVDAWEHLFLKLVEQLTWDSLIFEESLRSDAAVLKFHKHELAIAHEEWT